MTTPAGEAAEWQAKREQAERDWVSWLILRELFAPARDGRRLGGFLKVWLESHFALGGKVDQVSTLIDILHYLEER